MRPPPRSGGGCAASRLPCLLGNNSTGAPVSKTSYSRKQGEAITQNVISLCAKYGQENIGMLTLTFPIKMPTAQAAQKKFNSFRTHVLRRCFYGWVKVFHRSTKGRIHYHLVVACPVDIQTGFDFNAVASGDYTTPNPYLKKLWKKLRTQCPKFGMGRHELLPLRSTPLALGRYVASYLSKSMYHAQDAGVRKWEATKQSKTCSMCFQWNTEKLKAWRSQLAIYADNQGATDLQHMHELFGRQWAKNRARAILNAKPNEWDIYRGRTMEQRRELFALERIRDGKPEIIPRGHLTT